MQLVWVKAWASAFLSTTWVILMCRKQSRNVTLVTFPLEMEIEIPLLQMEKLRLTDCFNCHTHLSWPFEPFAHIILIYPCGFPLPPTSNVKPKPSAWHRGAVDQCHSPSLPKHTLSLPSICPCPWRREDKNVKKKENRRNFNFLMFSFIYKKSKVNLRKC